MKKPMRIKSSYKKGTSVFVFVMMSILAFSFLYPIYFMIINSLKSKNEYRISPFAFPKNPSLINYELLIKNFKILLNFENTLVIAVFSVVITMLIAIVASYAFAKLRFKGRKAVYLIILATMFIPAQVTMIPMYSMFSKLGLVNNLWSVIISYIASTLPSTILLLTSSFMGISNELIEAAKMDGAGYYKTVRHIIVPMGMPAIAISVIFNFLMACNDLFTPMILLQSSDKKTVVVALMAIVSGRTGDQPYQLAGLIIGLLPPLIIYLVFSKFIVKGLTVGAIK